MGSARGASPMTWSTCTSKALAQTRASPSESIETRDHAAASRGTQYTADSDDRSASYRFPSLASIDTRAYAGVATERISGVERPKESPSQQRRQPTLPPAPLVAPDTIRRSGGSPADP